MSRERGDEQMGASKWNVPDQGLTGIACAKAPRSGGTGAGDPAFGKPPEKRITSDRSVTGAVLAH